jgi:long-chain acyl-CoA synthetase
MTQTRFDNPDVIIPDVIRSHGKWRANKPAVIYEDGRLSWGELDRRVDRVAGGLIAAGLKKGDKVSLLSSNRLEYLEVLFGIMRAGGVAVPLSALVAGRDLARMVDDSDSTFLFVGGPQREILEPFKDGFSRIPADHRFVIGEAAAGWVEYEPWLAEQIGDPVHVRLTYEDPINIMYTSGTTGVPKGILHTHHNRTHFALAFGLDYRLDSTATTIITTSLYANGTWLVMLPTVFAGGTLVIMSKFEPSDFLSLVQKHRCTHTFMVPTQFVVLFELPDWRDYDISSMRVWNSAGSPLRVETKKQIVNDLPGELIELWGLTEGVATTLKPEDVLRKVESVGQPLVGWDVGIIGPDDRLLPPGEIGEIIAHSAFLMPEYYKLPDKTAESIWLDADGKTYLRTGDMGKLDEEGFLYILDRKKDMILSGGINIFAIDLESILIGHPDVDDVAVIGVAHDKWGETPVAVVRRREGATASAEDILAWANPQLAKYQRLSKVVLHPGDFPRNALGKVLKRELRDMYPPA